MLHGTSCAVMPSSPLRPILPCTAHGPGVNVSMIAPPHLCDSAGRKSPLPPGPMPAPRWATPVLLLVGWLTDVDSYRLVVAVHVNSQRAMSGEGHGIGLHVAGDFASRLGFPLVDLRCHPGD